MSDLESLQCQLTFDLDLSDIADELDTTLNEVIELWRKDKLIKTLEKEFGTLYILEISKSLDDYGGVTIVF